MATLSRSQLQQSEFLWLGDACLVGVMGMANPDKQGFDAVGRIITIVFGVLHLRDVDRQWKLPFFYTLSF